MMDISVVLKTQPLYGRDQCILEFEEQACILHLDLVFWQALLSKATTK